MKKVSIVFFMLIILIMVVWFNIAYIGVRDFKSNIDEQNNLKYKTEYYLATDTETDTVDLSQSPPYKGMPEKYISKTAWGDYTEVIPCIDFDKLVYEKRSKKYKWITINGEYVNLKIATILYDKYGNGTVNSVLESNLLKKNTIYKNY